MILKIIALSFLFVFLAIGARMVIAAFDKLVTGLAPRAKLAVAAIFVALSTSLPELFVTLAAAFEGRPEISLSTLLGSNVANLSIIIGGATLIAGALPIVGDYWRWELAATFLAGVAPILLLMDGQLTRLDGLILILIYLIYLEEMVIDGKRKNLAKRGVTAGILTRLKIWHDGGKDASLLKLFLGLALMMVSADLGVKLSVDLASFWGVPTVIVGFLVIALGTSLPEFALSLGALATKNMALVLGNLLGSVVTNATLIVGLLALIHPFSVAQASNYALVNIAFVAVFGLFWLFTSTKRTLSRFEGLILFGLFLSFSGLQLMFP